MRQARARIFGGDTRSEGKLLSLFEPSTEIIRKGKLVGIGFVIATTAPTRWIYYPLKKRWHVNDH